MKRRASGVIVLLALGVAACGSGSTGSGSTPHTTAAPTSIAHGHFPDDSTVPTDFAMFSGGCNADVRQAVLATIQDLRSGAGRERALAALRGRTASLMGPCPEVGDTAVTDAIAEALDPFLKAAGVAPIASADEIVGY